MWFHAIYGLQTLSAIKRVRIIDYNELNNFLFGKERNTKNRNKKRTKALPATVFSEILPQKFDSTRSFKFVVLDSFYSSVWSIYSNKHSSFNYFQCNRCTEFINERGIRNTKSRNGSKRPVKQIKH